MSADDQGLLDSFQFLIMSIETNAVYRGTELDCPVKRPDRLVKSLVAAGVLPKKCHTVRTPLGSNHKWIKCGLMGAGIKELARYRKKIVTYVDDVDPEVSPLCGEQTWNLLLQMQAHAAVTFPQYFTDDIVVIQFLLYCGDMFRLQSFIRSPERGPVLFESYIKELGEANNNG